MTLEEALLVADHGGDCRAALQVLAEAVRAGQDAVAAERERCAQVAESYDGATYNMATVIALSIRERTT